MLDLSVEFYINYKSLTRDFPHHAIGVVTRVICHALHPSYLGHNSMDLQNLMEAELKLVTGTQKVNLSIGQTMLL